MIVEKLKNSAIISDDNWEVLKEYKDAVVLFMSPKQIKNIMTSYIEYLKSLES